MEHSKNAIPLSEKPWLAALMVLLILFACGGCQEFKGKVDRPLPIQAPLVPATVESLKANVVSIVAERKRSTEHGFGFIVGEREGDLFIVTANHVVRSDEPDDVFKRVTVKYFQDPGTTYEATLLETGDKLYDLAVLRSKVPKALQGYRKSWGPQGSVKAGIQVWFVGLAGEWYVPSSPAAVTSVTLDCRIRANIADVQPGTSGAPLIAESGIIGMIVTNAGGISEAVCIDIIKQAFEQWKLPWNLGRGEDPIKLAIFPWQLTGSADSYTHMVHEALNSVLNEMKTKLSTPILSYYEDTHIISNEDLNKLWSKKGLFSSNEPNIDLIAQIGKQLKVYAVLTYSLDIRETFNRTRNEPIKPSATIEVFLIDVENKRTYTANGDVTDFIRDRFTVVRQLTTKVFADYKSWNTQ